MNKTYGVCVGMLAMGLAVLGAPVSRAAGDPGKETETTPAVAVAPAASSPADLDRRIEALESELSELRVALAAKKEAEAAPAAAPAVVADDAKPADKITVASLLGPTSVSGFVDGYYQINFNHPVSNTVGLRSFDFRDRSISLNMAELILDKAPAADSTVGRIGYHVAVGYGDGMDVYGSFDPNGGTQFLLKEAYGSYLAPIGKGLQLDFGKFVTPMGAEVVESKDNWNYSRGLLFTYAIPFYNFGVRAKYNLNDKYSVVGFLVNGWNNVTDNNTGKSYGVSFNGAPTKTTSFAINYLAGPEETKGSLNNFNVNNNWRQTWDAVAMYNPTAKWSFMANFDYARGDRTLATATTLAAPGYWTGIAGYAKYALSANDYLAGRYEWFYDRTGYSIGLTPHSHVSEFTATYQHTFASYFLTRLEYRRDQASTNSVGAPFAISTFPRNVDYQNTASISMIFLFDSRNAK